MFLYCTSPLGAKNCSGLRGGETLRLHTCLRSNVGMVLRKRLHLLEGCCRPRLYTMGGIGFRLICVSLEGLERRAEGSIIYCCFGEGDWRCLQFVLALGRQKVIFSLSKACTECFLLHPRLSLSTNRPRAHVF